MLRASHIGTEQSCEEGSAAAGGAMNTNELRPGIIVRGPVFPEPIEVLTVTPLGGVTKIVGAGQKTGQVHQRVLHPNQLQLLEATPEHEPFDGDPARFRL